MAHDSRSMKIALNIKRKKKAGQTKLNGGANEAIKKAENSRKIKFADGHVTKGGIHRQNGGPDNEKGKYNGKR